MGAARAVRSLVAVAALCAAARASAGLGEPVASIGEDQAALAARRSDGRSPATYRVVCLVSPSRTVREYVTPGGRIFAVTWEGVSHPDLGVVLGTYAAPVQRALAAKGKGARRGGRRVEAEGAVVETWGHARALRGRAWVPALVPAGVALDEIR